MSLKITIEIALEPGDKYTAEEAAVINALSGDVAANPAPAAPKAAPAAPAAAPKAAPKAAPAKVEKPAPAPTSPQSTKAAVLDTTIDEEPEAEEVEAEVVEEAEEDLLGGGTTFTKEEAIARATKLISGQKMAIVKKALAAVGAKKVSDLNDADEIQAFMAAVDKAEQA